MNMSRTCGVLLHPLSLSGEWLCGTMGSAALAFIDFCADAGLSWWQILPLGPTAYGDSPYQSPSAFAGNPYLIDPQQLLDQRLISEHEANRYRGAHTGAAITTIDYERLFTANAELIRAAWRHFSDTVSGRVNMREEFAKFCRENSLWLDDFALFAAIKESEGHRAWNKWPQPLRFREPGALKQFALHHDDDIRRVQFTQFLFFSQWRATHEYARSRGVRIIGDIPIFAAFDSADVWAHPELFKLDDGLEPTQVAGVPPDYFTATGQLWGNPLYNWPAHALQHYAWWIARVKHSLRLVDALRIDHFRGFEAYWSVPAGDPTAERGCWEKGPGRAFFRALEAKLGKLPIIAEDLGFITPEVIELRDSLGFPGMRILQFAFEAAQNNPDYPHNYPPRCIAYTGTHDNDTAAGWYSHADPATQKRACAYLGATSKNFAWKMIRAAWASPAQLSIAPMQDFLGLGSEARMNYPGTSGGWWRWRMCQPDLSAPLARTIRKLSQIYFRAGQTIALTASRTDELPSLAEYPEKQ